MIYIYLFILNEQFSAKKNFTVNFFLSYNFHLARPQARQSYGIDVCVCLFVCLLVPPETPQKPGPLGTFWIPWTFRYLLGTLNLQVPFGCLGPLGAFWISWTFRYLSDSLDLQVPFGYLGPLGTFRIPWTFRYLLDTLDAQVPVGYIGPLGTFQIPQTFRYLFDTLDIQITS